MGRSGPPGRRGARRDVGPNAHVQGASAAPACPIWDLRRALPPTCDGVLDFDGFVPDVRGLVFPRFRLEGRPRDIAQLPGTIAFEHFDPGVVMGAVVRPGDESEWRRGRNFAHFLAGMRGRNHPDSRRRPHRPQGQYRFARSGSRWRAEQYRSDQPGQEKRRASYRSAHPMSVMGSPHFRYLNQRHERIWRTAVGRARPKIMSST